MSDLERSGARLNLARHRLKRADFTRLYRLGRRAKGRWLTVVVLENELGRARLGLSVSKKIARRAVDRNRVRRILREAFRLRRKELPTNLDLVLIASAPETRLELAAVESELLELVMRARRKPPRKQP
jgi:ribonuclease P protein component